MFEDHAKALWFTSRPVCTLTEYIRFRGNYGIGRYFVPENDPIQGKGAPFYEQILDLHPGPGDPPTLNQNNEIISVGKGTIEDLPDTRENWNIRLFNYRRKILFGKLGQRSDNVQVGGK